MRTVRLLSCHDVNATTHRSFKNKAAIVVSLPPEICLLNRSESGPLLFLRQAVNPVERLSAVSGSIDIHGGAGAAPTTRELVADQFAATAGETCPLLLAFAGRRASDEAALWDYGMADRGAVASGGIAGAAVAGKLIQSQEGTKRCLTKSDGKVVFSSLESHWGRRGPVRALGPAKENKYTLESPKGYTVWGCWELKRKSRRRCPNVSRHSLITSDFRFLLRSR